MAKKLKIWNGQGYCCRKHNDPVWDRIPFNKSVSVFAAAYSRADLRRMITEYCGNDPGDREIKEFWMEGCWGDVMDSVALERGLWLQENQNDTVPLRLI